MNVLADESLEGLIVRSLRQAGHDVEWIAESTPGASDDVVLEKARIVGRLLLTSDKDFGELIFRLGQPHAGVLLVRLEGLSTAERARLIEDVLRAQAPSLMGRFAVLGPRGVRIRQDAEQSP